LPLFPPPLDFEFGVFDGEPCDAFETWASADAIDAVLRLLLALGAVESDRDGIAGEVLGHFICASSLRETSDGMGPYPPAICPFQSSEANRRGGRDAGGSSRDDNLPAHRRTQATESRENGSKFFRPSP
jgi:hypothetical protein